MDNAFVVEFEYQFSDFRRAAMALWWRSGAGFWLINIGAFLMLFVACGLLALLQKPGDLFPVIIACSLIYFIWVHIPKTAARRSLGTRLAQGKIRLEVSERELRVANQYFDGHYQWPVFLKVVETPEDFIFQINFSSYWAVPKRAFGGKDEVEQFRRIVFQNWAQAGNGQAPIAAP